MGKSPIGLILVVGLVAVAGWCFLAGPCKGMLGNAGIDLGNSIGGVLNPIENTVQKLYNDALSGESLKHFGAVPTGAVDSTGKPVIVSQSQMPTSDPTASFTHSYMGHLSYW